MEPRRPRRPRRRRTARTAVVGLVVAGLFAAMPPVAAGAPTSRVERVQVVAALFESPPAVTAARRLAGIAAPAPSPSSTGGAIDTAAGSPAAGIDDAAGGLDDAHDAVDIPGGDYFDPFAPPVPNAPLGSLLPDQRRYLLADEVNGAVCPVDGARFWNDWGQPRSGGRYHTGTDLVAPYGTPVYALWDATVTRVDLVDTYVPGREADLGGITVSYTTADGTRSYNGHLASVPDTVVPGATLRAGMVIGFVGDTGNARHSVPHLHIQIHPGGGAPVNPYPLLAEICRPS